MNPGPLYLDLPLEEPAPVAGCARCQQMARRREAARAAGDMSRVSDCNVLMRKHQRDPH